MRRVFRFVYFAVWTSTLAGSIGCQSQQQNASDRVRPSALISESATEQGDNPSETSELLIRLWRMSDGAPAWVIQEPDHFAIHGMFLVDLLAAVYGVSPGHIEFDGVDGFQEVGIEIKAQDASRFVRQVRDIVPSAFGLTIQLQESTADVIVLSRGRAKHTKLIPSVSAEYRARLGAESWEASAATIDGMAHVLESLAGMPVINETKLGGTYMIMLRIPPGHTWGSEESLSAIAKQTGLGVSRDKRRTLRMNVTRE